MYGCALETMYSLLALNCLHNLSLPAYERDSSFVRFLKTRKLRVHPPLHLFTIPSWPNVRFRCFLIGPKVKVLNMLNPLAFIYVTLVHCYQPCELLHSSHLFTLVSTLANILNLPRNIYDAQNCQSLQRQFFQTFPNTSDLTLTTLKLLARYTRHKISVPGCNTNSLHFLLHHKPNL